MKIGIDTFGCDPKSGVGSYLLNFISYLPQEIDYKIELFGFEDEKYTYQVEKDVPFISVNIKNNEKSIRRWHKYSAKSFIKKNNYDIVLFPAADKAICPSFKGYTGVAIINSVISSDFKNYNGKKIRFIKKGLHRVQKIIAATEYVKSDLVKLGIHNSKIKVIANGINHKIFYPSDDLLDDIVDIKPFAIKRPYFVYGSTISNPDKKHVELIRAFNLFKKNTGLPHRLVIAGNESPYSEKIHKEAYNSEYASDILITGYFPHQSFPKLYAGSDACVFPSVSEGSGLPVLEAFACGIPVICSDKAALPEISKDAAIYFDSNDIEKIAWAMQEVIENKPLREEIISKGLEKASKFDWETTVLKTIEYALN